MLVTKSRTMCKVTLAFIFISVKYIFGQRSQHWGFVGNPLVFNHPCDDNSDIIVWYETNKAPGKENQYGLIIKENFTEYSRVYLKFDSDALVTLKDNTTARITTTPQTKEFEIYFFKDAIDLELDVRGPFGAIPYVKNIEVNMVDYCTKPKTGYLDGHIMGYQGTAEIITTQPDDKCGRRKIEHTELIVAGRSTKPGDWPWHAAVYSLNLTRIDYICGGTLLSKTLVLTAAHCVTSRGQIVLPETRNVILGKYSLFGGDKLQQEREVHEIIVHENFNYTRLDNDITLLKLKSEVVYGDYIQPICLWYSEAYKKLPVGNIFGTVVGWGFDRTYSLSPTLRQTTIPKQSESACIKSNPFFYYRLLTDSKFCAGYQNGTSACNGDSGGGFHVFIPDVSGDVSANATGAWYIRGIVCTTVSKRDSNVCDPNHYVIFTDVEKFTTWIKKYMI